MKIYDISPRLEPGIPVWPGDEPFSRVESQRLDRGDELNLSHMKLSLHTGAHMDAPAHYLQGAPSIEQIDLSRCMGSVRVVTIADHQEIRPADLEQLLTNMPPRLLIRSTSPRDFSRFPTDYPYFSRESAELLVALGVMLVGTEAPSVDPFDDSSLPAHQVFGKGGVLILENLMLDQVPDGDFELIALPLRIEGAEASPVRAVLRAEE